MSKRILVAENDKLNMRLFHDLLTSRGYETVETTDGLAALAAARSQPPDLVLADMQLPGMSGLELTKRLRSDALLGRVPVVAVTAFVTKADEALIRASGVDDLITKPVAPSRLIETVERNLVRINGGTPEVPQAATVAPWTIAANFRAEESKHQHAPAVPAAAQPETIAKASKQPELTSAALAFAGTFLAVALAPAAGLQGFTDLHVVRFADRAPGLGVGSPVMWQRMIVGRVVRVELDPDLRDGVRIALEFDHNAPHLEDLVVALRRSDFDTSTYLELRRGTAASGRLDPQAGRSITSVRSVRAEIERELESLPRWFDRAAATLNGAVHMIDRRDTAALSRAVARVASLMETLHGAAETSSDPAWAEDIAQILAECRDLYALFRQIAKGLDPDRD